MRTQGSRSKLLKNVTYAFPTKTWRSFWNLNGLLGAFCLGLTPLPYPPTCLIISLQPQPSKTNLLAVRETGGCTAPPGRGIRPAPFGRVVHPAAHAPSRPRPERHRLHDRQWQVQSLLNLGFLGRPTIQIPAIGPFLRKRTPGGGWGSNPAASWKPPTWLFFSSSEPSTPLWRGYFITGRMGRGGRCEPAAFSSFFVDSARLPAPGGLLRKALPEIFIQ